MSDIVLERRVALEEELERLRRQLAEAQLAVKSWTNASNQLSLSAAKARAKNQSAGRGAWSALFGSSVQRSLRQAAVASNASIARHVATKRQEIALEKLKAQQQIQLIKERIAEVTNELKKIKISGQSKVSQKKSLDLLMKLKEAHTLGILTDQEFEEKKLKLLSEI